MSQAVKTKKIFDGRYEILSIVGRGSRSVVYHARHVMSPSVEVALKVLLPQKGREFTGDKLRKEALAMVSSRHRYVVRLDDFHSIGELCYLSMEFAPERDLRTYVQKIGGKLPIKQAEIFLSQCAQALDFVHRSGITHRDVKPENILVLNDREIRLADFGLAVLAGEDASVEELKAGVGTMDYLSPEVLEGKSFDARADIYALALSFYEMLTGIHPFANAPMAKQLEVRQDFNLKRLSTLLPDAPSYLDRAIMQALAYDPSKRFATGQDLVNRLNEGKKSGKASPEQISAKGAMKNESTQDNFEPKTPPPPPPQEAPKQEAKPPTVDISEPKPESVPQTPKKDEAQEAVQPSTPSQQQPQAETKAAHKTEGKDQPFKLRHEQRGPNAPKVVTSPTPSQHQGNKAAERPKQPTGPNPSKGPPPKPPKVSIGLRPKKPGPPPPQPRPQVKPESKQASATPKVDKTKETQPQGSNNERMEKRSEASAADEAIEAEVVQATSQSGPTPSEGETPPPTDAAFVPKADRSPERDFSRTGKPRGSPVIDQDMIERVRSSIKREDLLEVVQEHKWRIVGVCATVLFIVFFIAPSLIRRFASDQEAPTKIAYQNGKRNGLALGDVQFPFLPSGLYSGSIRGFLPDTALPLAFISFPQADKLVVVVGIEGWTPNVIQFTENSKSVWTKNPQAPLRVVSNGYMLDLTGQTVDNELVGYFRNIVTGEEGEWHAQLVSQ